MVEVTKRQFEILRKIAAVVEILLNERNQDAKYNVCVHNDGDCILFKYTTQYLAGIPVKTEARISLAECAGCLSSMLLNELDVGEFVENEDDECVSKLREALLILQQIAGKVL